MTFSVSDPEVNVARTIVPLQQGRMHMESFDFRMRNVTGLLNRNPTDLAVGSTANRGVRTASHTETSNPPTPTEKEKKKEHTGQLRRFRDLRRRMVILAAFDGAVRYISPKVPSTV